MKNLLILFIFLTSVFLLHANDLNEGFEVDDQDPFTGSAELTWTGDVGDFEITSSGWPYGSTCDFNGDHSIRSRDVEDIDATIVTDISSSYSSSVKMRWEVYFGGNSASITYTKGVALILFVNSDIAADIESGNVNGYRLLLADPDGLYLEKASGNGWSIIDEYLFEDANINEGWNIAVEREADGTWNWGFSNGILGNAVTLTESVLDNDHVSGDYSGMYWFCSTADAPDFGFDNFKVDPYTPGLWRADAASSSWSTASNWDDGNIPTATTDVNIPAGATQYPVISATAYCKDLTIAPGAELSVSNGITLNVNGDFLVQSDDTGTGSFLNEGNLSMAGGGSISFERFIEAYTGADDGWHQISSPVNDFTVAGSDFEPGSNDDLFRWDEDAYLWMNYKDTPFDFSNGKAYLVAYAVDDTKKFTGSFNNSDITFTDLSLGSGNGWHLLGNPYPCALNWNDGKWALSNIAGIAKVYSESAGNYIDITAGGIIPVTQGFFVQALDANNSITIPKDARTHDNTPLYSPEQYPALKLKTMGDQNSFYDISTIAFHPEASLDFDAELDARKFFGQASAPQLYTSTKAVYYSTNTLPLQNENSLDLYFESGLDGTYEIAIHLIQNFEDNQLVVLEDKLENLNIDLTQDSTYEFSSSPEDPADRFLLHFVDVTATQDIDADKNLNTWYSDGCINIMNAKEQAIKKLALYDLNGRLIFVKDIAGTSKIAVPGGLPEGLYLLKLGENNTFKIFIH
ncbi:MAG: T9SS type A sorting domain-containing protein [Bacteroidales bacterium]|nr:T9SS type A sorting domain-containing protein [Bacteroidales bacterium]MCF8388824.1 T9SS type A sorting domain-containing protein [Bacteroidales bacterium]MCF8397479.1 T9SS type A sorting domain-containing protein [Bacteroidales bacterium]